jgi:S-methylmethionine-dependent homocysteine/selenocysteine methylase
MICVMYTLVEDASAALGGVMSTWSRPVGAYPHAGRFVTPNWQFTDEILPEDFASEAEGWIVLGAWIHRGCCSIGPEHGRALW